MQVYIDSPDSLLASFESGNESGRLILVTGPSGSGKTLWCLALAERVKALGFHASGLVSPAVFEGDLKIGIDLLDLGSGSKRHLAARRGVSVKEQITEDWHIDDETLNWGNDILAHSVSSQFLILDELGPLELERGVGLTTGIDLIAARSYRLACVAVRPSLLGIAKTRWPWGEILRVRSSHPIEARE